MGKPNIPLNTRRRPPEQRPNRTNNSQKHLRPIRLRRRFRVKSAAFSVSDDETSDGDRWRRRRHSGAVFGRTLPARLTTIRPCVYSDKTPLVGGGGGGDGGVDGGCVERTFVAVARVFSSGGSSRRLLFLFFFRYLFYFVFAHILMC